MPRHVAEHRSIKLTPEETPTDWFLFSGEKIEEFTKRVMFEAIPFPSGRGRVEFTSAPRGDVKAENETPGSQDNIFPFFWTGASIPIGGNVTKETQAEVFPHTAYRFVVESGTMIFNMRAF
jgi:hypothetical protein